MQANQTLEHQIMEEENRYKSVLEGKEFYALKSIKNNIKKLQRQLYSLQKNNGGSHSVQK